MKSSRVFIALSVLLLTVGVGVKLIWDRDHLFYPTPETESAFLRTTLPRKYWTGSMQRRVQGTHTARLTDILLCVQ
jgi:hypothetical protein